PRVVGYLPAPQANTCGAPGVAATLSGGQRWHRHRGHFRGGCPRRRRPGRSSEPPGPPSLPTPTVATGNGMHLYFRHPGRPVSNFARRLPGLDFRGDGGYVMAPPPIHPSGRRYAWVEGLSPWAVELAPLPDGRERLLAQGDHHPRYTPADEWALLALEGVARRATFGSNPTRRWRTSSASATNRRFRRRKPSALSSAASTWATIPSKWIGPLSSSWWR